MADIFVDTDNSDVQHKLYNATQAGGVAQKAETIMQKVVKEVVGKAPGFTLNPSDQAKGYQIRLKVVQAQMVAGEMVTKISGQIVRYPKDVAQGGAGKGETMVSLGDWSAEAKVKNRNKDFAILDGVQACVEKMIPKSITPMRTDFLRR